MDVVTLPKELLSETLLFDGSNLMMEVFRRHGLPEEVSDLFTGILIAARQRGKIVQLDLDEFKCVQASWLAKDSLRANRG